MLHALKELTTHNTFAAHLDIVRRHVGLAVALLEPLPPCLVGAGLPIPPFANVTCCANAAHVGTAVPGKILSFSQQPSAPNGDDRVEEFLRSCSVQDCSYIISLEPQETEAADTLRFGELNVSYRIAVIDIDHKR